MEVQLNTQQKMEKKQFFIKENQLSEILSHLLKKLQDENTLKFSYIPKSKTDLVIIEIKGENFNDNFNNQIVTEENKQIIDLVISNEKLFIQGLNYTFERDIKDFSDEKPIISNNNFKELFQDQFDSLYQKYFKESYSFYNISFTLNLLVAELSNFSNIRIKVIERRCCCNKLFGYYFNLFEHIQEFKLIQTICKCYRCSYGYSPQLTKELKISKNIKIIETNLPPCTLINSIENSNNLEVLKLYCAIQDYKIAHNILCLVQQSQKLNYLSLKFQYNYNIIEWLQFQVRKLPNIKYINLEFDFQKFSSFTSTFDQILFYQKNKTIEYQMSILIKDEIVLNYQQHTLQQNDIFENNTNNFQNSLYLNIETNEILLPSNYQWISKNFQSLNNLTHFTCLIKPEIKKNDVRLNKKIGLELIPQLLSTMPILQSIKLNIGEGNKFDIIDIKKIFIQTTPFKANQFLNQSHRDEQEQNEFRVKMQTMHDKLKDQTKIGRSLNGDHGNDPPSLKSFEDLEFFNQLGQIENQPKNKIQLERQFISAKDINSNSAFDDNSLQKGIFQQKQEYDDRQQPDQDLKQDFSDNSPQNMLSYDFNANDLIISPQSEKLQQSLKNYNESSEDSSKYKTHQHIEMNNFSMMSRKDLMRQDNDDSEQQQKQNNQQEVNSMFLMSIKQDNFVSQKSKSQSGGMLKKLICCLKPKKKFKNYKRSLTYFENLQLNKVQKQDRIKFKILKFASAIKQRHLKKNLNDVEPNNLKLISDLSCQHQNYKQVSFKVYKNSILRDLIVKYQKLKSAIIDHFKEIIIPIKVFMPTSSAIVLWDLLQIAMTYLFLFLYSIEVFFAQNETTNLFMVTFFEIILSITLIDILKKFNTSYFEKDQIIQVRSKIIFQYITSSIFITDVISLSTIIFKLKYRNKEISYNPNNSIQLYLENFLIFLLLNRALKQKKLLQSIITLEQSQKHLFWLFSQVLNVVTVAHIVSIAFYMLGVYENQNNFQTSWLQKYGVTNLDYYNRYIYSIYWAVTTMTTESELKNRDKQAEDKIIGTLSNQLREEITEQINSKILQDQNIFKDNFSQKINKSIVFIMEEVLVSPNEIIFQENDIDDQSIYFIQSGIVEIYSDCFRQDKETSCKIYQTITQNQFFGEISFFSGLARSASARSVNLATLYRIKRERFIDLLKTSEYDFERFKMIQEKINIHGNLNCLYLKCYSCKKLGHLASNCPATHAFFDKQFIFLKNNFSEIQERQTSYKRAERTKQLKPLILAKKNIQICKKLKEQCRNINSRTQFLYNITSDEDEAQTFDINSLLSSDAQSTQFGLEIKSFAKQATDLSQKIENKQIQRLLKSNQDETNIIEKQIDLIKQNSSLNDQISNNYDQQYINGNFNISADTQYFSKVEQIVSVLKKQNNNNMANENSKENSLKQNFVKSRSDFKNYLNNKQVNFNIQNTQSSIQEPKNQLLFQKKISKDVLDDQDVFFFSPQIKNVQSNLQQNNKQEQHSLSATCFKALEQQLQSQEKGEENITKDQLKRIKSNEFLGNKTMARQNSNKQINLQFKNSTSSQIQEFASEKIKNSQKVSHNLIRSNDYSQNIRYYSQEDLFEQVELCDFEKVKIFKKFFPHNNIDKVITVLKKIQVQQKKDRFKRNLERRRQIVFALDNVQNRLICETPTKNNIRQKKKELTSLSYGVTLKSKEQQKQAN
ncbi:hypothetical protein ABPG73_016411 [Tetrahymena malaccensis]